ncbi:hypothetical protein F5Y10DRAFT_274578 [Nemania abortiva]|nr:hypothetical protein F5Y10DRAFT_274578 [Nemania abortiva]
MPGLGKPTRKKKLSLHGLSALLISLISFSLAVWVVASEKASWHLGVGNNQLIVIGFLLSIMNLCLASVTPTLFTLLEAKLGPSTLQNYDGIVRNSPLATGLSLMWRAVLVLMLALPILLSVAYKAFLGGESTIQINSADYISNTSFYGLWRTPGMETDSFNIGTTLFTNATLPFRVATTPGLDGMDPPLPNFPQSYGQNILLLNNESTALLDTLQTDYLVAVQNLLRFGESWIISAPVSATVATFDRSKINDPDEFISTYLESCKNVTAYPPTWDLTVTPLFNNWSISLLDKALEDSNQTIHYVGLIPGYNMDCEKLAPYAQRYNVERWQCQGTWRITRAGFDLIRGSCDGGKLPWTKQQVFEWNQLGLGYWYMPCLIEALGAFSGNGLRGNQSSWMVPTTATAVATMLWSRVVGLDGQKWLPFNPSKFNMSSPGWQLRNNSWISFDEAGVIYPVDQNLQTILYIRPTLRKSPLLYAIFAVQPLLSLVFLAVTVRLYSVPVSGGFGLVSILSGVNRQTLNRLAGASLSGELTQPVKLVINPVQHGQKAVIEYHILPPSCTSAHKKIDPKLMYN